MFLLIYQAVLMGLRVQDEYGIDWLVACLVKQP